MILLKKGTKKNEAIYVIHDGLGSIGCYMPMTGFIKSNVWIYGIENEFVFLKDMDSFQSVAAEYIKAVQEDHICLIGFSIGGVIAYEMACQLNRNGKNVMLVLIDSFISRNHSSVMDHIKNKLTIFTRPKYDDAKDLFETIEAADRSKKVWQLPNEMKERICTLFEKKGYNTMLPLYNNMTCIEILDRILMINKCQELLEAYCPQKSRFDGKAVFFRAMQNVDNSTKGWRKVLKRNGTFYKISGDHHSIMGKNNAEIIVEILVNYCKENGGGFYVKE